ncbi:MULTISPECIES: IclR family transcriptional regulator [Paraburkholderia]|jgi:DNA-binding IclR family transcriptional regulator|uniref:IclR family transcriptional regulator n=1 Tax=Paraburkholderia madseniana TaxID=2599607 RepID=A0AAP5BHS1_9BURK|nr:MULTISPECIES: IclR family transcriptional regulator [Paraburkholderia]MCX4149980.1 IclR family transcriptional regulator [Paraburkholderia madseniana]MDN7152916.1 IclR family transcriptional regulator [Paraburkholderia sp. WS6]MDQ6411798.1 IclR family transcriptional regulator [Paraburkholderia madseniana]
MKTGGTRKEKASVTTIGDAQSMEPSRQPRQEETAEAAGSSTKSVPAVRRAVAILSFLAEQTTPMSLSQVARAVDILPSSCLHILRELAAPRLVSIDPRQKSYRLGPGIVDLARAAMRQDPFAEYAKPHLKQLADTYGVTATATAMIDDDHMACVAFAHPPVSMSLNVTLGGRVPTFSGAAGRCMAAFGDYPRSRLRSGFAKVRWQTPLTFEDWMEEVEQVKRAGYSEDQGAFVLGVTTIAAPIFGQDASVRGIIGVGAITAQLDDEIKTKVIASLKHAAREFGMQLPS